MILLQNNKIVVINEQEDDIKHKLIKAIKTLTDLQGSRPLPSFVRDSIYTLTKKGNEYVFINTQSPYRDGSGIGSEFGTPRKTVGEVIYDIIEYRYNVTIDDVEVEKLTKT